MEQVESHRIPGAALDEPEESRRGATSWLLWLVVALVVYVLSVGPMVKLSVMLGNRSLRDALVITYSPLRAAYQKSSAVKHFFDWYLGVWGVK